MDRRQFLKAAGSAAGLGLMGRSLAQAQSPNGGGGQRPNIIFIFSDDHAPSTIGAYEGWLSEVANTPNIDRIAEEGAIFTQSFCTNSICAPSRAAVLTGKFSHENGQYTNYEEFDGSQFTFPQALQDAGYTTAMIGKWHLRSDPTGFDHWEILPGQGSYYNPDFLTPNGRNEYEGHVTEIIADLSLEWLENGRDPDKPFLLCMQDKAPHRSWMPPLDHLTTYDDVELPDPPHFFLYKDNDDQPKAVREQEMEIANHMFPEADLKVNDPFNPTGRAGEFNRMTDEQREVWDAAYRPKNDALLRDILNGEKNEEDVVRWMYERYLRDYLRCCESIDDNIGRLLDYLDETGLAENTIVIYSSDQGFFVGERGWFDKRWIFEESLQMPFIIRWPGAIEPGQRIDAMIQNIDYAPTFLEIAGVEPPPDVHGQSLLPLFRGEVPEDWRQSIYYHYYEYEPPSWHNVAPHYGVRMHDGRKLFHYYHEDHREWQMTDLNIDPHELHNLHDDPDHADTQAELKAELRRLQEYYEDPILEEEG